MLYFCSNCGNKMDEFDFNEYCKENKITRESEILCPFCTTEMDIVDVDELDFE